MGLGNTMIPDSFILVNITDTCAIWHLVGSMTLFKMARRLNVSFVITNTVFYECFTKTRGRAATGQHQELRDRLETHIKQDDVKRIDLTIDDLQDLITLARQRGFDKRLGHGEISCAALALRWGVAVLTDNRKDFRAISGLVDGRLQTTPRLLGWLYLDGHLTDPDVGDILSEHRSTGGQMSQVYERAHHEACEKRLARQTSTHGTYPS